jgi:aspartokinase/homoserine dehydrogenase 2
MQQKELYSVQSLQGSVHKFGGSSLADATRFHAVADILQNQTTDVEWVVVSAPADTTNQLMMLIDSFDQPETFRGQCEQLKQQFDALVYAALPEDDALRGQFKQWLDQVPSLLENNKIADVLAIGELFSATLLSAILVKRQMPAVAIDARSFLTVQDSNIDWQSSLGLLSECVIDANRPTGSGRTSKIKVLTGFIGRDPEGQSLTLGRNGSDYTATIIAALTNADSVTIWTDVDAIYSADPRRMAHAMPYRQVSLQQAGLLASFGNTVLHARTISPLAQTGCQLFVRNSFRPEAKGCKINEQASRQFFLSELPPVQLVSFHRHSGVHVKDAADLCKEMVIALPSDDEKLHWLVATSAVPVVIHYLQQNHVHPLVDVQPYYGLVQLKAEAQKQLAPAVQQLLIQQGVEHSYEDDDVDVWLFRAEWQPAKLDQLHQLLAAPLPQLNLIVAGTGNVGAEFLTMLQLQQQRYSGQYQLPLVGLLNSHTMIFGTELDPHEWREHLSQGQPWQPSSLLEQLATVPSPKVLIDITPSQQFAMLYPAFVEAGCHIISANKQGVTLPSADYQTIIDALRHQKRQWLSNTTVGAGIPVQRVMGELVESGDHIHRVSGVFSGTLSWLLCHYDGSVPFSELVIQARTLGFTEPDPRDDLSGKDVQRKLLVLARALATQLDLDAIELQPLLPAPLELGSWEDCWQRRSILDDAMRLAYQEAQVNGKVLRYVASLDLSSEVIKAQVQLTAVSMTDPLAALAPCDNIFVIESNWYAQNPLVMKGPGAGRQVTAGGLHADVMVLLKRLTAQD